MANWQYGNVKAANSHEKGIFRCPNGCGLQKYFWGKPMYPHFKLATQPLQGSVCFITANRTGLLGGGVYLKSVKILLL